MMRIIDHAAAMWDYHRMRFERGFPLMSDRAIAGVGIGVLVFAIVQCLVWWLR